MSFHRKAPLILATITLVSGCASTPPVAQEFPRFTGSIIPIEVPFEPRYEPYRNAVVAVMDMDFKHGSDTGRTKFEMRFNQSVRRTSSGLDWLVEVSEMTLFGSPIKTKEPVMTIRLTTDSTGEVEGLEVAYPGFAEMGITDVPPSPVRGSREYDDLVRQFAVAKLPPSPVVSGDPWVHATLRDMFGELPGVDPRHMEQPVRSIVKGWAYYGSRRVLVVEQTIDVPASPEALSITVSGYTLYDAATLAQLKTEAVSIITGIEAGKHMFVRIDGSLSGTLAEN